MGVSLSYSQDDPQLPVLQRLSGIKLHSIEAYRSKENNYQNTVVNCKYKGTHKKTSQAVFFDFKANLKNNYRIAVNTRTGLEVTYCGEDCDFHTDSNNRYRNVDDFGTFYNLWVTDSPFDVKFSYIHEYTLPESH